MGRGGRKRFEELQFYAFLVEVAQTIAGFIHGVNKFVPYAAEYAI